MASQSTPTPRRRFLKLALCAPLALVAGDAALHVDPYAARPDVRAFLDGVARRNGFDRAFLYDVFAQVRPQPAILHVMRRPGEAQPWHRYRDAMLNRARIEGGVAFWQRNQAALARARARYGVSEALIVAIIGIETVYGKRTGTWRVIEALSTLAFDFPRRAALFRDELEQFLLFAREQRLDPLSVRGSYAGAIGLPQFMPSSARRYAVDFDGDGRIDLSADAEDAIGSVANYFHAHGWRPGLPIALQAAAANRQHANEAGPWTRMPVPNADNQQVLARAFMLEERDGPQYWLGLENLFVITTYNKSLNYAMAVHFLSRELAGRMNASQS